MRRFLLLSHRGLGWVLACFLVIIGATGSVISFFPQLDNWANPELLKSAPRSDVQTLDPLVLRAAMEALDPKAHVYSVHFPLPGESFSAYVEGRIDPKSGGKHDIGYDEVFADPYTGERLGTRQWGSFSFERKDWFTQLYFLHYSLVLPEELGEGFMGVVALFWAFDCVIALALTLPRRGGKNSPRGYWQRWLPAWKPKLAAGANRATFDWHRASGLWLWPMLLVFAWSGFALNLPSVYEKVMSQIVQVDNIDHPPKLARPLESPAVGWTQALALGERYMREQAERHGFEIERPWGLIYRRETGTWYYRVRSSRDVVRFGATSVAIDAQTGAFKGVAIPTGHRSGDTFTSWIKALHMGMVGGVPMQLFVSACGLLVVVLSLTGVAISIRKMRTRRSKL
jgi:uncharacterized iron-regulated membrane protein